LRTLQLQDRSEPLRIWGPRGTSRLLQRTDVFGGERLGYELSVAELDAGATVERKGFAIRTFPVSHQGTTAVGYLIAETTRLGRFNPDRARELGVPEGPAWGTIHRGLPVVLDDGRTIEPSELVGPSRPGRRIVITGDSRPCPGTMDAATEADLLVHEATFAEEESARASDTGHSTAREAALIAAAARVRRLVLTHVSARYSRDTGDLEREARAVFPATVVARDGLEIEVPFADEPAGAQGP